MAQKTYIAFPALDDDAVARLGLQEHVQRLIPNFSDVFLKLSDRIPARNRSVLGHFLNGSLVAGQLPSKTVDSIRASVEHLEMRQLVALQVIVSTFTTSAGELGESFRGELVRRGLPEALVGPISEAAKLTVRAGALLRHAKPDLPTNVVWVVPIGPEQAVAFDVGRLEMSVLAPGSAFREQPEDSMLVLKPRLWEAVLVPGTREAVVKELAERRSSALGGAPALDLREASLARPFAGRVGAWTDLGIAVPTGMLDPQAEAERRRQAAEQLEQQRAEAARRQPPAPVQQAPSKDDTCCIPFLGCFAGLLASK